MNVSQMKMAERTHSPSTPAILHARRIDVNVSSAFQIQTGMEKCMKKVVTIFMTFALLLGASAVSMAQTATPRIDKRERHQQRRIRQGVRSGSLTRREAAKIEHQEAKTRAEEAAAKADGTVTAKERRHLRHRVRHTNRTIYRQKHDNQTRRP